MTHLEEFRNIAIKQLHPTFAAEVTGVDFSKPISEDVLQDVKRAIAMYGVLVFRQTGLDDQRHVEFSRQFGELDDASPYVRSDRKHRLEFLELFDVGNIDEHGNVRPLDSWMGAAAKVSTLSLNPCPDAPKQTCKGNAMFHVDSSFNPRRAGISLLRAVELPPPGTGGETEFADTRSAFTDLADELQQELLEKDYVVAHSLMHSRKTAAPDVFKDVDPEKHEMAFHKLVQLHEPSGRMNLYIAAHSHHIEGLSRQDSDVLLRKLYEHACQPKYVVSISWENNGDMIMWDNTCVMHRATGGSYMGKYKRDMRRATVHDGSSYAWGLNEVTAKRQAY